MNTRAVAALTAGIAGIGGVSAMVAQAAPPTPDQGNLVVFPNRDFITIEGFADHANETARIEVTRGTALIGAAEGKVSGGEVAFEINHPGGVCWAQDASGTPLAGVPQVTPDIKPGDKVSIKFGGQVVADTTVQNAYVNTKSVLEGNKLTIKGFYDGIIQ